MQAIAALELTEVGSPYTDLIHKKCYPKRFQMRHKVYFFILGIVLWSSFGAIIGSLSANILSYTWTTQAAVVGVLIGAFIGSIVGLAGLSASSQFRFSAVILWMLAGSLAGASIGFKSIILFGGYPRNSQADLSFITLAPAGLAVGTVLGTITGLMLWKYETVRSGYSNHCFFHHLLSSETSSFPFAIRWLEIDPAIHSLVR